MVDGFPAEDEGFRWQMSQFFDATTDAIFFLDREYRFTFLNRQAQKDLAPAGDMMGQVIFDKFPGTREEPYFSNYTAAMERGEARSFEAYYPEPMNFWVKVQAYPFEDGIVVYFRDITQDKALREFLERKTAEAERQHAEIESVYRTAPIGLALFDLDDYHYVRLNDRQASFFGMKPEEIVGKTLIEMAPIEGLRELFDGVAAGVPVVAYPLEGSLVTDPGTHRYWTVSYFPVYGADGTIQGITAASLEVTQQKKAELALVQSEKLAAVGRLASSIAHEINNPLEAVTNLLYLAMHSDDLQDIRTQLGLAEMELRRVSAITAQTLKFHKQASNPQAVTAEELLESVLSIYQGRITNSRVKVDERYRALKPVRCFEGEIRQVLSNLVSNALDAMNSHEGKLCLRTRLATNWATGEAGVSITVADTGSGMSAVTLRKLFDPFFTTKGMTGTGLGLWVSKEIVDRHRGRLQVKSSQAMGHKGTVFSLFLPFAAVAR